MLIIYAHPNKKGHCGYILKKIQEKLDENKKDYKIIDLYQINFNPVLQPEEHYTSGNKNITKENQQIQKLIKNTRKLVVIYPTWWNGTPAILKGFFDRILTSGFAFEYKEKIPRGLLQGKAVAITTTGGPIIFERLIAKSRSIKTVTSDTLKFCGFQVKGLIIGSSQKLTEKQKNKIDKKINKLFHFLEK